MGNKLCKKKSDVVDNPKSPTPFDRIINRLHLRPNSWKSDSHLNQKQVNRYKINPDDLKDKRDNVTQSKLLSKSSDWTDVNLEVPDKDEAIHLRNPKLSLIFDDSNTTPTPPPRKHKKGFREKIEAVAKNGLQAFQSKKPVEEVTCVKKTIKQTCPVDDHDCAIHNRNHKHETKKIELTDAEKQNRLKNLEKEIKDNKRRKNLSVVSLPNYSELKLTLATFDDSEKKPDKSVDDNSLVSLPNEPKKMTSTGKLETCMTRCRSFGSLLPQQLLGRLKVTKKPIDIESDDSFGGLEDWDLRIIEHYNPKDASLPRASKLPKSKKNVLSDVEKLIVQPEEEEKPKVPARRAESLLKKINREATETAVQRPQELPKNTVTPPPAPKFQEKHINVGKLPTKENGKVEHSSLLKVLEEFSIRDKQNELNRVAESKQNMVTNTPVELQKNINSVESFLHNEKLNAGLVIQQANLGNMEMATT